MPALNGFHAHVITVEPDKKFPNKKQIIPEHGCKEEGNTVTCYIPATSGAYFAAWWWPTGKQKHISYSAEFLRDGESVVHLFFGKEDSAKYLGGVAADWEDDDGNAWKFQFRSLHCTGKDEEATNVPYEVGTLELIIRNVRDVEMKEVIAANKTRAVRKPKNITKRKERDRGEGSSAEISAREGGERPVAAKENVRSDSKVGKVTASGKTRAVWRRIAAIEDEGQDRGEGSSTGTAARESGGHQSSREIVHEGYRQAQALYRAPDNQLEDIFHDWKNPKPRHTHTAEMTRPDGRVWKCYIDPLRSLPKHRPGDEQNIIVKYVFIYTSPEKIKLYTSPPPQSIGKRCQLPDSLDPGPTSKQPRHEGQEQRRLKVETPPIKIEDQQGQAETDKLLALRQDIDSTSEQPKGKGESCLKAETPIIKTEEDLRIQAEIDKLLALRQDIDSKIRKLGSAVEGDEEKPIIILD